MKQLISLSLLVILLIAIPLTIYLVRTEKILKSKASNEIYNAFEVTDPQGSPLPTREVNGQRVYDTDFLDVTIRIRDLEGLTN
ncbi:MAG: hypothetical protein G01um10147_716 [Microgenomates group bacterium Gr01-1014_7]|nr:MAG: hypothetical protein G01um10147_716 [Microgenomates group bacterium Gr01-1014_7]